MSGGGADLWPRTVWMEAVWSSPRLRPLERLTAGVYADHARNKTTAYVTLDRLMERTGMSRDAANRARRGLVDAGWLVQVSAPNRRAAAVYELATPPVPERSASRTARSAQQSASQTTEQSASQGPSSPPPVPERSASRTQPQDRPQTIHSNARATDTDDTDGWMDTSAAARGQIRAAARAAERRSA